MSRHRLLKNFEGFTRVRVGAILIENESILLIRQMSLFDTTISQFMPPGGGLNFQESLEAAVERECYEETGLNVKSKKLLYIHEFIYQQVHAVELFFLVDRISEHPVILGSDPELPKSDQVIQGISWISLIDLEKFNIIPQKLGNRLYNDYKTGFNFNPVLL